jgi:hypothetical protein
MIKLFYITLTVMLIVSCKKIEYGNYQVVEEDTPVNTPWQDNYGDGGTISGNGTSTNNQLNGTKWVLVKVVSAFSTNYPNDTITFVSNNRYVLNQNAQRPYTLTSITGSNNRSLTLNWFVPFGGSNYSGQISQYASEDGLMSNIEFNDLQNNTSTIRAWFVRVE